MGDFSRTFIWTLRWFSIRFKARNSSVSDEICKKYTFECSFSDRASGHWEMALPWMTAVDESENPV
jgi:hypothetical protein